MPQVSASVTLMVQHVSPPRTLNWLEVRDAFIKRPERPTYDELSGEFQVPIDRIKRAASQEGWAVLRAAYLDRQLAAADAGAVVLQAVRADAAILRGCTDLGLVSLERLKLIVEAIPTDRAASTQSQVMNTVMFAFANLTKALKDAGVSGLPQTIRDGAQKDNGRWNGELLQQINVTVQNLQAGAKAAVAACPVTSEIQQTSDVGPHGNGPTGAAHASAPQAAPQPAVDVSAASVPPAGSAHAATAAPGSTPTPPAVR